MKIGVLGCAGRMGRSVMAEVLADGHCDLIGGSVRSDSPALGHDLGSLAGLAGIGIAATDDVRSVIDRADVVVEFTTPEASLAHAALSAQAGTAHVLGATGLDDAAHAALRDLSARTPLLWAANMSQGVNLLLSAVEQVARALAPDLFDIEVVEMHHRDKVDAPSGTALALGEAAARGRAVALPEAARLSREGLTGARPHGEIGFATLRGGDVVGEHVVIFAGKGERIELGHRATDRRIFARGAVRAATWLAGRPPGLYDMLDVLGMRDTRRSG
ncbi:4-hydroxy-tetrahydrodipicolinate reductase [Marinivivus vitaminiproducens]|uniref:4-hydroxy-tetrahydrodipicolinate reductase n=1 Tax=Marinivivus vitaminiproducens TaxID=3035935 RepID=UPI0027A5BB29|nr:4-hydroxy-tetrahydrodipicolinate reductase [Geminicoccaceae bacterium SCSIO 64248]